MLPGHVCELVCFGNGQAEKRNKNHNQYGERKMYITCHALRHVCTVSVDIGITALRVQPLLPSPFHTEPLVTAVVQLCSATHPVAALGWCMLCEIMLCCTNQLLFGCWDASVLLLRFVRAAQDAKCAWPYSVGGIRDQWVTLLWHPAVGQLLGPTVTMGGVSYVA